ncbi:MAG: ORF6C domain-containing protein [Clostridiales bacterium]|nr:ORF6C domain-containing protein [Clostridiales bacterium]
MENLMLFENHEVEIFELNGKILFNPYHVGECLELSDEAVRKAMSRMNSKQVIKVRNSDVTNSNIRKLNNAGENFLTESGVYKLVFKSRKPNAEEFSDWVTDDVLPSIRKTGMYQLEGMSKELQAIIMQDKKIQVIEQKVENLESNMTLDYAQQQSIGKAVNKAVIKALGGKNSNAYHEIGKKVFSECNRDIKDYFCINARNNIPRVRFQDAMDYIGRWEPSTNTRIMIQDCNAQLRM